MKIVQVLVLIVFFSIKSYGLPLRNPKEASFIGSKAKYDPPSNCFNNYSDVLAMGIGFYGDYVFDRNLETTLKTRHKICSAKVHTNAALITLDICKRIELFTTLGESKLQLKSSANSLGSLAPLNFTVETDTRFSWSVGLNGWVWQYGPFALGLEAQYLSFTTKMKSAHFETLNVLYPPNSIKGEYKEWQLGLGIAYIYHILEGTYCIPYIGVDRSHAKGHLGEFTFITEDFNLTVPHFNSKRFFGYVLGVSLVGCGMWELTIEGRMINEKACHANVKLRF